MATLREQIAQAIKNCLDSVNLAGGNVFRSREVAFAREELPAVVITPDTEDTARFASSIDESHLMVQIEFLVRGDPWDSTADQLFEAAHAAITADETLGGLCTSIRRSDARWNGADADGTAGSLQQRYRVTYLSSTTNLSTPV